jgi:hypothetical protein
MSMNMGYLAGTGIFVAIFLAAVMIQIKAGVTTENGKNRTLRIAIG